MNILVICLARLGDIIESTSMLKGLKLKYPDCRITYLLQSDFRHAAPVIPYIDKVIEFDFRRIYEILFYQSYQLQDAYNYLDSFFKDIKKERFDKIIDITPNNVGILSAFLSGDSAIINGKISDWMNYFLTVTCNWHTLPFHFCDMYTRIAGLDTKGVKPEVKISDRVFKWADLFLNSCNIRNDSPLIGFNPGASNEVKMWPKDYFIETGKMILNKHRVNIILYGSKSEEELCHDVRVGIGSDNIINAAGRTDIEQFASLLLRTDIFITNDTGSMHLASACNTKIISLHTGKEKCFSTGPYGTGHVAIHASLSCHPCNNPEICKTKKCRYSIKPSHVFNVFEELIDGDKKLNRISGYSNVYISRIDEKGMVDYVPAGRQILNTETFNRYILRFTLDNCLSEGSHSDKDAEALNMISRHLYSVDLSSIKRNWEALLNQFKSLIELCDTAIPIIKSLQRAGVEPVNNIENLKKIASKIEAIDCQIIGKAESIKGFETLAHIFRSEKSRLNGADILLLAEQTGEIYLKLRFRCETVLRIYHSFASINNKQEKENYHEHFSQRNTGICAA